MPDESRPEKRDDTALRLAQADWLFNRGSLNQAKDIDTARRCPAVIAFVPRDKKADFCYSVCTTAFCVQRLGAVHTYGIELTDLIKVIAANYRHTGRDRLS